MIQTSIDQVIRPASRKCVRALVAISCGTLLAGIASAQLTFSALELKNISAYADLVRKDLRAEKRTLVAESLDLTPEQTPKFWAVYDGYEKAFAALWDLRLANTKKYAENYEHMTDRVADELARTLLENDSRLGALRSKYYAQFKAAVGPRLAARFLHVVGALDRLVELQFLAQLPLLR
jgi:hypothetical protein